MLTFIQNIFIIAQITILLHSIAMKAMILAAGLGTRLRPLTNEIPKPMVPVVGIPNIERILLHLRDQGISDVAVNLHYQPEPLMAHLGDGDRWNTKITYFHEPDILGTGGGIKNMLPAMGDETFVVVNGDVLFMPPLAPLVKRHKNSGAMASMIVRKNADAEKLGAVGLDNTGRVKRLVWAGDKSLTKLHMFTGMHIIEPQLHKLLPDMGCIVRQTYIPMVEQNKKLHGIVEEHFFCDLGTPADYLNVNLKLARGDLSLPAFSPPPDGNFIPPSVVKENGAVIQNSVLGQNVRIGTNAKVTKCVVMDNAVITEDVDRKIILANGTQMDTQ